MRLPKVRLADSHRPGASSDKRRFFVHPTIDALAADIVSQYGSTETEKAMLFPSSTSASRCIAFFKQQNPSADLSTIRLLRFVPDPGKVSLGSEFVKPRVCAVVYPKDLWPTAKAFWQHTGEGISSRQGEFCHRAFLDGSMIEAGAKQDSPPRLTKGPRRYQKPTSVDHGIANGSGPHVNGGHPEKDGGVVPDSAQFVEERFGRNLNAGFARQAKLAVRKRIAGSLTTDSDLPGSLEEPSDGNTDRSRDVPNFSADDVYIYPRGMNAIFNAHTALRAAVREERSIMYGFPYVDTLKVLEKFGPGAVFYGHGNADELDELESRLEAGERFLSLFCEFPGNPLLKTPDLKRIRQLSEKYDFAVVIDETIGNFLNVHLLPHADVLVSSLTKIFSGDSNVMGGAMILNPNSRYYARLKQHLAANYEDNEFEEDSIVLERNSRDFVSRIHRVNHNAEVIADILGAHPSVKQVNYPKHSESRHLYDAYKLPDGGYGGLLSATFHDVEDAKIFYDHLDTQKGPSLGTNFTLSSPFVLLAHYGELDWAAKYGCEVSLVRFSVGLEETEKLKAAFDAALAAIPKKH